MRRDGHVVTGAHGEIRIEGDALARLVLGAAELVEGARARRPRRGLEITLADGRVRIGLELAARYGATLPELGRAVQERVAGALRDSASLDVERIDVSIEELDG